MMQELKRENQQLQSIALDMQWQMGINRASIHQKAVPFPYDTARLPPSQAPFPKYEDWPWPPPSVMDDDILPSAVDIPPPPPRDKYQIWWRN